MGTSGGASPLPAWRRGGDLTPLEEKMLKGAETGEPVSLGEGPFTVAEMQAWQAERTIRAAVLRHLLVADEWPADAKGVQLCGLRISGNLDIEAATLRCRLFLDWCYLDASAPTCLDFATAPLVILTGCHLAGLTALMLSAKGLVLDRSTFTRAVLLTGADIVGQLSCAGAQLTGSDDDGNALVADQLKASSVFLTEGFTAAGAVRLDRSDIASALVCRGAHLTGSDNDGNALVADQLKAGMVFLDEGFTAVGAVRLAAADIAGQLKCDGAQLTGSDDDGNALVADQLKVGSVLLTEGFTAAGAVRLPAASIAGQLACRSAQLTGSDNDGNALLAGDLIVGGDVLLDGGFTAAGCIYLKSAQVGGSLDIRPVKLAESESAPDENGAPPARDEGESESAPDENGPPPARDEGETKGGFVGRLVETRFVGFMTQLISAYMQWAAAPRAVDLSGARIAGALSWAPAAKVTGRVSLEGAEVGQLEDDWSDSRANGYWPVGGLLNLDGFIYSRIGGGDKQTTVDQRLNWIRSQYPFATQPYEQLAAVYRRAGQDDRARKVAIAKRRALRKYGNLNLYRRFGNWFLDTTIRYGYHTWRAGVALAALFLIFWGVSALAQQHHLIAWSGDISGLHFVPSANSRCTSSYPCFYPFGYTVDTVIPLINVHQADFWGPDGSTLWGVAFVVATWIATGLGWALTTLLVAGYTGLVRRD